MKNIAGYLAIVILSLIVFWPSFQMALYGDEWKVLWMGKSAFATANPLPQFSEPNYAFEILTFLAIERFFGDSGLPFYLFSFLCRMFAVGIFYWFLLRRGVSSLSTLLAGLLFAVTPIGIEATDWVRNFDSYLGIGLLLIIIDRILVSRHIKDGLLICGLFFLAVLITPIRSHGILLTTLMILGFRMLIDPQRSLKTHLLTTLGVIVSYVLIAISGIFGGDIYSALTAESATVKAHLLSFLHNVGTVGAIPNINVFGSLFILASIVYVSIISESKLFKALIVIYSLFFVGVINRFPTQEYAILGLYLVIVLSTVSCYRCFKKDKQGLVSSLLVICFCALFLVIPAIKQPFFKADYTHRYLIFGALGLPLLLAFASQKMNKYFMVVMSIILVIYFGYTTHTYLKIQLDSHNQRYTDQVWSNIRQELDSLDINNRQLAFYFEPSEKDQPKVGNTINFGFFHHVGLIYHIWDEQKLPLIILDRADIQSMISDGKVSRKYLGKEYVYPPTDVYIFLVNDGSLIRQDLKNFLNQSGL